MNLQQQLSVAAAAAVLVGVAPVWVNSSGKEQKRVIPPDMIYSREGQKGMKQLDDGLMFLPHGIKKWNTPYGPDLSALLANINTGLANVILVRGKDVAEAVNAAREALTRGRGSGDVPFTPEWKGSEKAEHWLVFYLGTAGSVPPAWLVESVEFKDKTIRVNYLKPIRKVTSGDAHRYLFWVPLGQLPDGVYSLELFDTGMNELTLMRRVRIISK
jgi:hypothetical protein